jgi:hypothetical protein
MLSPEVISTLDIIDNVLIDNYQNAVQKVLSNRYLIQLIKDNPNFSNGDYNPDLRGNYIPNIQFFLRLSTIYTEKEKLDVIHYVWDNAVKFDAMKVIDEVENENSSTNDIPYERLSLKGFLQFVKDFSHDQQVVHYWRDYIL